MPTHINVLLCMTLSTTLGLHLVAAESAESNQAKQHAVIGSLVTKLCQKHSVRCQNIDNRIIISCNAAWKREAMFNKIVNAPQRSTLQLSPSADGIVITVYGPYDISKTQKHWGNHIYEHSFERVVKIDDTVSYCITATCGHHFDAKLFKSLYE